MFFFFCCCFFQRRKTNRETISDDIQEMLQLQSTAFQKYQKEERCETNNDKKKKKKKKKKKTSHLKAPSLKLRRIQKAHKICQTCKVRRKKLRSVSSTLKIVRNSPKCKSRTNFDAALESHFHEAMKKILSLCLLLTYMMQIDINQNICHSSFN